MPAYSFKRRFVDPIRVGLGLALSVEGFAERMDEFGNVSQPRPKRQTIRAIGKRRHAQPGEIVQLYHGMRTRQCFKIGEGRCTRVRPIRIVVGNAMLVIEIDNDHSAICEHNLFAQLDGFRDGEDMRTFWQEEHGLGEFVGVLIEWAPL